MPNATMLYKCPGPHDIHGGRFDYIIVDADIKTAVEAALADGWFMTTDEARATYDKLQAGLAASVDANGNAVPLPEKLIKPKKNAPAPAW